MNILVCLKWVTAVRPALTDGKVQSDEAAHEVGEADRCALELAMDLDASRNSTTVITVGPADSRAALFAGIARGASHAVHIVSEATPPPMEAAHAVAEFVANRSFDLVLTGVQDSDELAGVFGIALAHELGWPVVSTIVRVEKGEDEAVIVLSERSGGRGERLRVHPPAVLTVQTGRELPYVPIMALLKAKRGTVEEIELEPGVYQDARSPQLKTYGVHEPDEGGGCMLLGGTPDEAAARLVDLLAERGLTEALR